MQVPIKRIISDECIQESGAKVESVTEDKEKGTYRVEISVPKLGALKP